VGRCRFTGEIEWSIANGDKIAYAGWMTSLSLRMEYFAGAISLIDEDVE
jgi:hypothetical protein